MVGAEVGDDQALHTHPFSVRPEIDFKLVNLVAPVDRALEVFAPALDPLDRPAQLPRSEAGHAFFTVNVQLAAEGSADFGRNHAAAGLINPDHDGKLRLEQVRDLSRRPDGERVFAGRVAGDHAARLHRDRAETLVDHSLLDDLQALVGFNRLPVPAFKLRHERQVVREFFMNERRALGEGLLGVGDGRERVVINFNLFGGVASQITVRRNDGREGFAHVADGVHRQAVVLGDLQPFHRDGGRLLADRPLQVLPRQDAYHATHGLRRGRDDGFDPGVTVHAADKGYVDNVVELDVVHIMSPPLDQTWVFLAFDPLPQELGHVSPRAMQLPSGARCSFGRQKNREVTRDERTPRGAAALLVHFLRGPFNSFHDVLVTRAAAQIPLEPAPDLFLSRMRIATEDLVSGQDHPRRAETALQAVLGPEAFLERVELAVTGQSFDGGDFHAVGLDGEQRA